MTDITGGVHQAIEAQDAGAEQCPESRWITGRPGHKVDQRFRVLGVNCQGEGNFAETVELEPVDLAETLPGSGQ